MIQNLLQNTTIINIIRYNGIIFNVILLQIRSCRIFYAIFLPALRISRIKMPFIRKLTTWVKSNFLVKLGLSSTLLLTVWLSSLIFLNISYMLNLFRWNTWTCILSENSFCTLELLMVFFIFTGIWTTPNYTVRQNTNEHQLEILQNKNLCRS